ncbi:hypothetical protein V1477_006881 [Vespula maculifrons]|uniref:Uncharacterized protein n=1 Tax=Vespula maculifrons TaxID=7453 RepID=A0ABD2CGY1_VESMC
MSSIHEDIDNNYHTNDIFIQYFLICSPSCTADNVDKNLLKITVTRVKDRCIYKCYKTRHGK